VSPKTKKRIRILIIAGVAGFALLQVFPAKVIGVHTEDIGTNPPERFALDAPPEVAAILRRSCYDCHTHETKWPLYARLAPGSWLMARDVHNGRNHLNFSKWGGVDEDERKDDLENCWEQVESGAMPKWFYVYPLHLGARLSDADKALLKSYFLKSGGGAAAPSTPGAK
jgi:Haem-binding domain